MLMKERTKSVTHRILESLNNRMELSFEDKMNYLNQVKGFEGECLFDQQVNHSEQTGIVLNDLLLSTKHTHYQIDSIFISNQEIFLYEIKNYEGNYTYKDDTLYAESGHALQNPIAQVNRVKSYLYNLFINMGYQYSITGNVAFMHPNFYIYSLPPTDVILFSGQLSEHLKGISAQYSSGVISLQDKKLANYLINQHNENFRPTHLPHYTFQDLKKGITCPECFSFQSNQSRVNRTCTSCGHKEKIADAIYRSVLEFQLLFPDMPINVPTITIWCGGIFPNSRIQVLLKNKFTLHAKGNRTFYT